MGAGDCQNLPKVKAGTDGRERLFGAGRRSRSPTINPDPVVPGWQNRSTRDRPPGREDAYPGFLCAHGAENSVPTAKRYSERLDNVKTEKQL